MNLPNFDSQSASRRNKEIIYYTQNYGREYKKKITEALHSVKTCFFVNPQRLEDYIEIEAKRIGQQYTMRFFELMGLPFIERKSIYVDENNNFTSDVPRVKRALEAFFPKTGYISFENLETGIFSFSSKFANETDAQIDSQINFWIRLTHIENYKEFETFVNTYGYKENKKSVIQLLVVAERLKREFKNSFYEIQSYVKKIKEETKQICEESLREYLLECKPYMSEESQKKLEENPDISLTELEDARLFCNYKPTDSSTPEVYSFEEYFKNGIFPLKEGCIESFLEENYHTEDENQAYFSYKQRWICLHSWGKEALKAACSFPHKELLYSKDWHQKEKLAATIPSKETIHHIKELREKHQKKCLTRLSKLYTLSRISVPDDEFDRDDLRTMFFDSNYKDSVFLTQTQIGSLALICPFDKNTGKLDFLVDLYLRQCFETSIGTINRDGKQTPAIKTGLKIKYLVENNYKIENETIDFILSVKLSLDNTIQRYKALTYLLVPEEDADLRFMKEYEKYVENFDLVFPLEIQEALIKSKINSSLDMSIYNYLSKETLNYINDLLLDTSGSNKTTLMQIRNYLNKHHSRIRKK